MQRDPIRERNRQREIRLLERSGLLDTDDLDWDAVGRNELHPETLAVLVYMRDVEGFTPSYLEGLGGHRATAADPVVSRFLATWEAEETEHARAIDRYLELYAAARGVTIAPQQAPRSEPGLAERLLVALSRPLGAVVTATHMAWGATNELLTLNGYRLLAARNECPILTDLLGRIAAQESRHYSFYYLEAEWRMGSNRLVRAVVRRLLRRAWTPVGVGDGYKRPDEFDRVLRHLTSSPTSAATVSRMDSRIGRLPGCADLTLFADAAAISRATGTTRLDPTRVETGESFDLAA